MPKKTPDEIEKIHTELGGLSEREIKRRLAAGLWSDEKGKVVENYLEKKELARRNRYANTDRNIQRWILALSFGTFVVALLTWFLI
jgi:hypothetical protein